MRKPALRQRQNRTRKSRSPLYILVTVLVVAFSFFWYAVALSQAYKNEVAIVGGGSTVECIPSTNSTPGVGTTSMAGTVTITSPNGGDCLQKNTVKAITWTNSSNITSVMLGYSFGTGSLNWITTSPVSNQGSYSWNVNVGNTTNTQVKIQVIGYSSIGNVAEESDNFFTVY